MFVKWFGKCVEFISDLAWTCGTGRTRAGLVNSSSVWSAGSSDGPVQAEGSGSAPPGCGYWRSSALYSAAFPASVTETVQSQKPEKLQSNLHHPGSNDLYSQLVEKFAKC